MIINKLKTLLILLLPIGVYAADSDETLKAKLDNLYSKNASLEEKVALFNSQFNSIFSYHDFLIETAKAYFNNPKFSRTEAPTALAHAQCVAENIEKFINSDNNNFTELFKQIKNYFALYGQNNNFFLFISLSLYRFEETLDWGIKWIKEQAEEHKDNLFLVEINRSVQYEISLEINLDKGIIVPGIPKDLLLRQLVKKAIKEYEISTKNP